jgi:DNA-binding IclR family transcriptional regulator
MTLLDDQGVAVASIGIAGPRARLERSTLSNWLKLVHSGAEEVASQMRLHCSCTATRADGQAATEAV